MPIIQMNMLEGRASEKKAELAQAVTDAVVRVLDCPEQSVRIMFHELKPDGFYVAGKPSAGAAAHARKET